MNLLQKFCNIYHPFNLTKYISNDVQIINTLGNIHFLNQRWFLFQKSSRKFEIVKWFFPLWTWNWICTMSLNTKFDGPSIITCPMRKQQPKFNCLSSAYLTISYIRHTFSSFLTSNFISSISQLTLFQLLRVKSFSYVTI